MELESLAVHGRRVGADFVAAPIGGTPWDLAESETQRRHDMIRRSADGSGRNKANAGEAKQSNRPGAEVVRRDGSVNTIAVTIPTGNERETAEIVIYR